ncbi:preprotein translocase subunit YajC [Leucobacter chromiireducens]|uniref:Preprotein translocase subunit YajC n=1 Tax=Leucobacter chromiireducens subsp. chromiireducens TaxID=660067 RepID=A0ABS1SS19_9MICO|nr:preprotein translocase subunit YajC [Leucobacter chromiireducens]MBL3690959.1 preprotein translocase subunit YajC [Leucobacter chromiireducens subsp. chromiireducens]
MDPITILMFALIALLIFFMFRNGKKRQQAMQELQNGLRPGAEVMLQSGIFGTIESVDEEDNKVVVRSGTSTLVAHRNAIAQIVTPNEAPAEDATSTLAPDDDPEFGERITNANGEAAAAAEESIAPAAETETPAAESDTDRPDTDPQGGEQTPKA